MPDDDYLLLVGQLAYMVSSLEGLIIFDLPGLAAHLPATLSAGELAGRSTGQIARALTETAPSLDDEEVRDYVEIAGRGLAEASTVRNDLLHSRPATVDGKTRLYRWKLSDYRGPHLAFPITEDWLDEKIDLLSQASAELNHARPLDKNAAFKSERDG